MFVHPYSKLYRERKFADQVREALLARGGFSCDTAGNLTFKVSDGRVFKVTHRPDSDFGRFVSATLELSVAMPTVQRALHVLLGQVAEARHVAMSPQP
jgi:hypothetical protein